MSKLPEISGRDCAQALARVGFYFKRQTGSHMVMRCDDPFAQVVVPDIACLTAARCERSFVRRG